MSTQKDEDAPEAVQLQQEVMWYRTEEKLPLYGKEVLCFCFDAEPQVTALARYSGKSRSPDVHYYWDNIHGGGNMHLPEAVMYWAKFPDPPEIAT